ncbi:UNVERIFIED_CONTAM: hypothetical protein Sindi_1375200 [Sesamum indicum]
MSPVISNLHSTGELVQPLFSSWWRGEFFQSSQLHAPHTVFWVGVPLRVLKSPVRRPLSSSSVRSGIVRDPTRSGIACSATGDDLVSTNLSYFRVVLNSLLTVGHLFFNHNMELGSDEGSSMLCRRGANKERSAGRRMWTILEEECLVVALRNLVVTGWKCDNGFRTGYLGQLESYIAKHFPQANIKADPHITSKLHVRKKQYSTLTTMLTRSRFGWDESRNIVTVEEDAIWDDYVKLDPSAKGMRQRAWPFFPAWREIFGRDRATGERSTDPFKEATEVTNEEIAETQECNVPHDAGIEETCDVGLEDEPDSSFIPNVDRSQNSSSAVKRTGGSSSRKRTASEVDDGFPRLVQMVTNFYESADARLGKLTRVLENEFGDPEHRSLILQQVRELEGLDENEQLIVPKASVSNVQCTD